MKYLATILFILMSITAYTQDKKWTLMDCMEYAVKNSPRRSKQEAQNSIYHQNFLEAVGQLLPSINASTSASFNFGRGLDAETNTYTNINSFNNNYNLYSSLTLFDGLANVTRVRLQNVNKLLGRQQLVHIEMMLNYIAQLTAWFGYEGLFLRGAITCGKLYESFNTSENYSFLASEGLVKAYQMETQAIFPMIVVEDSIVSHISNSECVIKNGNKYMLNYVRYVINEFANNEYDVIAEIQEILDKKNSITDAHVKEKYEWLINYYLWFINESHSKYGKFNLSKFTTFEKEINKKYVFTEYS